MNKFYLLGFAIIFLFLSINAEGQEWKRPLEKGGSYYNDSFESVFFVNENKGWAGDNRGLVFVTVDGGYNWRPQYTGLKSSIRDIFFIDKYTGWVISFHGIVIKTYDGGESWIHQNIGSRSTLTTIQFIDHYTGWIGGGGILLSTKDGGANWEEMETDFFSVSNLKFFDDQNGWVLSNGNVWQTKDGGDTWIEHESEEVKNTTWRSMSFVDEEFGWLISSHGETAYTRDGGETWSIQEIEGLSFGHRIFFADKENGWAIGSRKMAMTKDGGVSWVVKDSVVPRTINDVFFIDSSTGWIAGNDGHIILTTDGGESYKKIFSGTSRVLSDVVFFDSKIGLAGGFSGDIFKTLDGGLNWEIIFSEPNYYFRSFSFVNKDTGWAITSSPGEIILHTKDGGHTWEEQDIGQEWLTLNLAYFINENKGWVAGSQSRILKTENGGEDWVLLPQATNTPLGSMFFLDDKIGWIGGLNGLLMKTEDGGQTWIHQNPETSSTIVEILFFDPEVGYALGRDGKLLRTVNGGRHWDVETVSKWKDLFDFHWLNPKIGWIVGEGGEIINTTDGGISWNRQIPTSKQSLFSVYFHDRKKGWAVGSFGEILIYDVSCFDAILTRVSPSFTVDQSIFVNTPIFDIVFEIGEEATGAEVTGLPTGVESYLSGDRITISGIPTEVDTFHYTIITTGSDPDCKEASVSGTIIVNQTVSVYDSNVDGFRLYQNRPNPFRNQTTFGFEIPEASNVTFKFYDSSGKPVKRINADFSQGYNELKIHNQFPTGLYFYEIVTPFGVLRNKMLVK